MPNKIDVHYFLKSIGIFILIFLLCGCSTRKDAFFNRAYHSTTAQFNIIFNGNESYKEGLDKLNEQSHDNYTAILPVYATPNKTEALRLAPYWDKTVEKCSKSIRKHSMVIKGVEKCKPIDRAYLLLGQAYYQRQDYADALGVFNHLIFNHSSANTYPDAYTWKAQTLIKLDRLQEAEESLEESRPLMADHKKDKYRQHWEAVFADLLIAQKDYEQAVIYLSEMLKHKHINRDFKTRGYFILGQVQQNIEQYPAASKNYLTVLKRNPVYEMEFNATMNLAICNDDIAQSKNKLKKLFKDGRNETYKDQIFYTLALLDLKEEDTTAAINNLESSVFWSINNKHQKTLSALTLAEIYFSQAKYTNALSHYDTVLTNLSTDFPHYSDIKKKAEVLKDLVSNLMIIFHEDSMQYLASLDEKSRDKYIEKLIEEYKKQEEERLADDEEKSKLIESSTKKRQTSSSSGRNSKNGWIFADATQTKLGIQAFRKQWGNRVLEDYWFVNDIQLINDFSDNQQLSENADLEENSDKKQESSNEKSQKRTSNPTNKAFYLQDMPKNTEELEKSNESIVGALYNSGFIYYDDLNEKNLANVQWENLLKRFPNHKLSAPTAFQLYKSYLTMNNSEKSNYYKQFILNNFSQSDYARILQDSNYYKNIEQKKQQAELFYTIVYDTFIGMHYAQAYQLADNGCQEFSDINITSKLAYIKAISAGKLYGNDSLRYYLNQILLKYPATPIDTAASELLTALEKIDFNKNQQANSSKKNNVVNYVFNEKESHFVIIIVNTKEIKINQLKNNIVDFNQTYFRRKNFDLSNFFINDKELMVTIEKFENKNNAMDYYNLLIKDTQHMATLNDNKNKKIYVISNANYKIFFKNKEKQADYDEFFKTNYLLQK